MTCLSRSQPPATPTQGTPHRRPQFGSWPLRWSRGTGPTLPEVLARGCVRSQDWLAARAPGMRDLQKPHLHVSTPTASGRRAVAARLRLRAPPTAWGPRRQPAGQPHAKVVTRQGPAPWTQLLLLCPQWPRAPLQSGVGRRPRTRAPRRPEPNTEHRERTGTRPQPSGGAHVALLTPPREARALGSALRAHRGWTRARRTLRLPVTWAGSG